MKNRQLIIVSGLSGAGKSQVLNILEDNDFFCVDNLPVELINKFLELFMNTERKRYALGLDIRSVNNVRDLSKVMNNLTSEKLDFSVSKIFVDADNATILRRFSETRRKHPLGGNLLQAVKKERELLKSIKDTSDIIIDTTNFNLVELKNKILESVGLKYQGKLLISIISFGYKYGLPLNADMVFDTRFLPNPNYILSMKNLSGRNNKIKKYILSFEVTREYLEHLKKFLEFLLPKFIKEGKNYLTIAFGCTGGKHRSVAISEIIYKYIQEFKKRKKSNFEISILHRDE